MVSWDQVLAWRMRRQFLDRREATSAVEVAERLCGVQAQVGSAAELCVATRMRNPHVVALAEELWERRTLVKVWAMRGTLHLLPAHQAGAYLSLAGTHRNWERASWQRAFGVSPAELEALGATVAEALDGRVLSREELVAEVTGRLNNPGLGEKLRSGWGALLKPLAVQGLLCHGPAQGNRVTFVRPDRWLRDWSGLPAPEDAASVVIPAYLRAYGPASMEDFDAWLTRGTSRRAALRGWFASLTDELVTVDVEGKPGYLLAADLDELRAQRPSDAVRLLPGFDQYILGPGTNAEQVIPPKRRAEVSRTAGWISPVVIAGGRVVGVWELSDDRVEVRLFEPLTATALEAETDHLSTVVGRKLSLAVQPLLHDR